jgi:hypothetical protein
MTVRGAGRVLASMAIVVGAAIALFVTQGCTRSSETPPATGGASAPAPAPAATPAAPATAAADASAEPQQVATDPAFKEERGRKIASLSDVPDYPGATVVGSSEQARAGEPAEGYRAMWKTTASVPTVMEWYRKALAAQGWTVKPAESDVASSAEQITYIRKGHLDGYVAAESEGKETEITVSLQDVRRANKRGQR